MRVERTADPVELWLTAERYLGGRTRTYSRYADITEISAEHHPHSPGRSFTIPSFWVPSPTGRVLRNGVVSDLPRYYDGGDRLLLPVHPDALAYMDLVGRETLLGCERGPALEVTPLANARTVYVHGIERMDARPHQLKLHYPRRISRFTRRLRAPMIELELWVTDELLRLGTPILAEVGGGVFGSGPEAWGFLVRELPPLTASYTVPLFALYGEDLRAPSDRTVLEQLVAIGGHDPVALLTTRIVAPMVRMWVDAALRGGCLLEPHGQNTLVTFDSGARDIGIRYRDCGVYIDPGLRRNGRGLPPMNVIGADLRVPAAAVRSLTYDSFMGHHALDYLAESARTRLGVDPGALHQAAREAYRDAAGECADQLLPGTVYYYDETAPAMRWRLRDTGDQAVWR